MGRPRRRSQRGFANNEDQPHEIIRRENALGARIRAVALEKEVEELRANARIHGLSLAPGNIGTTLRLLKFSPLKARGIMEAQLILAGFPIESIEGIVDREMFFFERKT